MNIFFCLYAGLLLLILSFGLLFSSIHLCIQLKAIVIPHTF